MTFLVDTSVWSLALRRDTASTAPEVTTLRTALLGSDQVVTTGLILQELLQGFSGPKSKTALLHAFASLAFIEPERDDYIEAAELRNLCRRNGVQVGTIDALLAQLCIRHDLVLLSTDNDFRLIAKHVKLRVWPSP